MQAPYAGGSLLLVLGTWLLWTPQQLFPRIPLFSGLSSLPTNVDIAVTWGCLIAWLVVTACLLFIRGVWAKRLSIGYALLFGILICLDQHRLQPWAVHIGLCLMLLTSRDAATARRWIIYLTASIYIYSALSKFDAQFLHTVGQEFLQSLLARIGWNASALPEATRLILAVGFPLGELLCGVGLVWPKTRWFSLVAGIVMHGLLLVILGPWGLNHSYGVLLWNALFIAQNAWLCASVKRPPVASPACLAEQVKTRRWHLSQSACVFFMILPLGEPLGYVDHWLGWALYAPHSSRATIDVRDTAIERLPESLRQNGRDVMGMRRLSIDQWSLQTLGVPIYPQQRFYVGVARALAADLDQFEVRVVLQSRSNRFTGQRQYEELSGRRALEEAADRYWFNTQPVVVP